MRYAPTGHYDKTFYLTSPTGNNAFDYEKRSESHPSPQLRVAPLIVLDKLDEFEKHLVLSHETSFAVEEEGVIRHCQGLKNFLLLQDAFRPQQKIYIFDNHNHAFYFWHLARLQNPSLRIPGTLIHIDQHRDSRIPAEFLSPTQALNLDEVFRYTQETLNVGNFIPPAFKTGLIDEIVLIDSEKSLKEFNPSSLTDKSIILDIDLDFFAPDLNYIGNNRKISLIHGLLALADIITIATSPFFIDQQLAFKWLREIFRKS